MQQGDKVNASTATSPDLDCSQVTETVKILHLAVAQISMAMHEGEDSVGSLTSSFTGMVESVPRIAQAVGDSTGEATAEGVRSDVVAQCAEVQRGIQQSIIAFQLYGRLSQRLDHVRYAWDQLSMLVADRSRLFMPGEWKAMQQAIRSRYSMREEQGMFEALLQGATTEETLDIVRQRVHECDIDDIELC